MRRALHLLWAAFTMGCAHAPDLHPSANLEADGFVPVNPELIVSRSSPLDARIRVDRLEAGQWKTHWSCGSDGDRGWRPICHGVPGLPAGHYRFQFVDGEYTRAVPAILSGNEARITMRLVGLNPTPVVWSYDRAPPGVRLEGLSRTSASVTVRLTNDGPNFILSTWLADAGPDKFWVESKNQLRRPPEPPRLACTFGIDGFVVGPGESVELTGDLPNTDGALRFVVLVQISDSNQLEELTEPWRIVTVDL